MKRCIALIFALVMLFVMAGCASSSAPAPTSAPEQAEEKAEPEPTPEEPEPVAEEPAIQLDAEVAAAFGLADRSWISRPETYGDYMNNFLISFCAGEWEYYTDPSGPEPSAVAYKLDMKPTCIIYNALLGAFANQNDFYVAPMDGRYYVVTQGIEPRLDKDTLMAQQQQVLEKARSLREGLIQSGKITDDMSEQEKCGVYYDLLNSWNVQPSNASNVYYKSTDPALRTIFMDYDTAYACLVNRVADCGGRSAGMNLLLNLEGIRAFGISGHIKNTDSGHILTYVILDGKEYYSDFGNRMGTNLVKDYQAPTAQFEADKTCLMKVRVRAGVES